jgi:hypothetical protein
LEYANQNSECEQSVAAERTKFSESDGKPPIVTICEDDIDLKDMIIFPENQPVACPDR